MLHRKIAKSAPVIRSLQEYRISLTGCLLPPSSRHFLNSFDWERRMSYRSHCDGNQFQRIIVSRNSIGTECSAHFASVNNRPFTGFSYPHRYRFHVSATVGFPVARLIVYMQAVQTVWAMISMITSCAFRYNSPATILTDKGLVTWMCFVIAFFVQFTLVFSIHL